MSSHITFWGYATTMGFLKFKIVFFLTIYCPSETWPILIDHKTSHSHPRMASILYILLVTCSNDLKAFLT